MKYTIRINIFILCVIFFTGCSRVSPQEVLQGEEAGQEGKSRDNDSEPQADKTAEIVVYVCGQVRKPAVVTLPEGARVYQAVEKAGGFTRRAAVDEVNQAEVLSDGQRLFIPSKQQSENGQGVQSANGVQSNLVNINTAGESDLMTLPGIGTAKATAIVTYRNTNGNFQKIEDIMQIEGIKQGVFDKIKDMITT